MLTDIDKSVVKTTLRGNFRVPVDKFLIGSPVEMRAEHRNTAMVHTDRVNVLGLVIFVC